jgi:transcriptional regulator of arginine metabolism
MSTKSFRHKKIVEIIEQQPIATQEELIPALAEFGIIVSQSTLSKDIKQLGLAKAWNVDGTAQWRLPVHHTAPQNLRILGMVHFRPE